MLQTSHLFIDTVHIGQSTLPLQATLYTDDAHPAKVTLIYLHGGGLLAGSRLDLPNLHKEIFTQAGIQILALDYPLAPHAQINDILPILLHSIKLALKMPRFAKLPYLLWGRSAGAYLALLASYQLQQQTEIARPKGVLSFYGYGFLTDDWYQTPSLYYAKLPKIDESVIQQLTANPQMETDSQSFALYIYARQSGKWKSMIYQGRDKFFYLDYSLRLAELNLPLFFAHGTADPDVPFAEFNALCAKYTAERFIAATDVHDFDRDEQSEITQQLLQACLDFIHQII